MLRINDLHVQTDTQPILQGIDLVVKPGQVHALMGPNGSGKSTLAYTLAGHPDYQVTQGSIKYNRKDLLQAAPEQRARLGLFLAFQHPVAIPGISIQNFLKSAYEAISQKPVPSVASFRRRLQQTAHKLGIGPHFLTRSINDGFSGGEQKRLEVLQMLVLKPQLAIFDEIDSGLDIDSIKLVASGINYAVKHHRTTVLIITHYRRILDHIKPDQVHVIINGRITASDGPNLIQRLEEHGYQHFNK